ncbi:MAG: hypothetical protein VW124_25715 [Paracoccaceae bacterium]
MVIRRLAFLLLILGFSSSVNADETFSLDCENVAAFQFNMSPDGFDNYNAATDTYSTKYVYKGEKVLLSKYPSSSNDPLEQTAVVVKKGFHNAAGMEQFIEFASTKGRYLKTFTFHKKSNDGLTWRAAITNNGNNEGKLFQRTYWYHCKQIIGE